MCHFFINENKLSDDIKLQFDSSVRFSDFPLHFDLVDSLTNNGYIFPSPVQYHLLSQDINEDLIVQAKSGTGKTVAFTTYIINKILFEFDKNLTRKLSEEEIQVLFIAPTREICIQIDDTVSILTNPIKDKYSIISFRCIGGNPISEDVSKFHCKSKILLTSTPGRFIQLKRTNCIHSLMPDNLKKSLLCILLDEADRLFESCFVQQTKYILNICLESQLSQFIAFSATFPQEKLQIIKNTLNNIKKRYKTHSDIKLRLIQLCASLGQYNEVDRGFDTKVYDKVKGISEMITNQEDSALFISKLVGSPILKNVKFVLFDDSSKYELLKDYFDENDYLQWSNCINSIIKILFIIPFRQSVIFTNNCSLGYKITMALRSIGIPVTYTNGRRSQTEREEILSALKRNKYRIIVSSDLLSRGIDIKRVDLVVSIDIPIDKETFLHRAGRTGRFGQIGTVVCIPNSKTEYDSLLYIFGQLGIKYQKFSDYCECDEDIKGNKDEISKLNYINYFNRIFNHYSLEGNKEIDTQLSIERENAHSKIGNLNSNIFKVHSLTSYNSAKNSFTDIPCIESCLLKIEEIDRVLLNIWGGI